MIIKQNLPENYNDEFYNTCFNTWPGLCIVAEDSEKNIGDKIIGYTLGRVTPPMFNEKSDGFVISLAVNKPYRGKQIAQSLMKKLHDQLYHLYGLDNVSLHCRVSNEAAIKLYSDCFDYKCVKKVDGYYDDGTLNCKKCPAECLTCIGPKNCTKCDVSATSNFKNFF